jgi:hypothetical protein
VSSLAVISFVERLSSLIGSPFGPDVAGPARHHKVIGDILAMLIQSRFEDDDEHQMLALPFSPGIYRMLAPDVVFRRSR